jgi:arylsulfatase A-like enzyme
VLSASAVAFIKQSAGTPFMIEVATFAPHLPFTPAPRDADAFPGLKAPRTQAFNAAVDPDGPDWLKALPALKEKQINFIDLAYRKRVQSVLAVDKMIGDLQAAVSAIGQLENTYFIFSSDNGFHLGEYRLTLGKMTAYDTDIHVPLVITGPGIKGGQTSDAIVENIDLCPTFIELAGAAMLSNVDGRSLTPFLRGETIADWRTAALIEHHGPVRDIDDPDMPAPRGGNPTTYEAVRTPAFLYVEYASGEREYHALAADPNELHNTFASLSDSEKASLHKALAKMQDCRGARDCLAAEQLFRAISPPDNSH